MTATNRWRFKGTPHALCRSERQEIRAALSANPAVSFAAIGRALGRCPSTISREVGRNGGRSSVRATRRRW
ncbi:MAG: helix-turn-helix domain-containing protein [Acidimicrobiales bacterium]